MDKRSGNGVETALEIMLEIVKIFQPDGEPNEAVADAGSAGIDWVDLDRISHL